MIDPSFLYDEILTEEEKQVIDTAKEFGREYFTEDSVRLWYEEGGVPNYVMEAYRDTGLGLLGLTPHLGGVRASFTAQAMVVETLSKYAGAVLPMQSQISCMNVMSRFAREDQIKTMLDAYAKTAHPGFSLAFADDETGSDFQSYKTAVYKEGATYMLRGRKAFVNNGMFVPNVLVIAKNMVDYDDILTAPFNIWLVPRTQEGVSVYPINTIGQRITPASALKFDDVELDPSWQIGTEELSPQNIFELSQIVRTMTCANSLGMAQAALEDAVTYSQTHVIRNRPIATFQQIAEMLVDMQIDVSNIRTMLYEATYAIDKGAEKIPLVVSLLKKYAPSAAVRVADKAIQIFGGVGYTDSTRVSRIWIDSRANQIIGGTDQIMTILGAKGIAKYYSK